MVQSRVKKFEIPVEEKKVTPQEVLRLQQLLLDNGWKMVKERMESDIKQINESCRMPRPLWLTAEQSLVRYQDLEQLKQKATAYEYALTLPYIIMQEYWETEFEVNRSKEV